MTNEHRDNELPAGAPELEIAVHRPGRLRIELEFTPDEVQLLRSGVKQHACGVTDFVKRAALAEAGRAAGLPSSGVRESA